MNQPELIFTDWLLPGYPTKFTTSEIGERITNHNNYSQKSPFSSKIHSTAISIINNIGRPRILLYVASEKTRDDLRIIVDPTSKRKELFGRNYLKYETSWMVFQNNWKERLNNLSYQFSVRIVRTSLFSLSHTERMPIITFKFSRYWGSS